MSSSLLVERPEWIYDQVLKIEKRSQEPEMIRLKEERKAVYFQKLGQEFPEFLQRYPKIFFRTVDGCLNKPMLLMSLKEMQKVHTGEKTFEEANHEGIGAAFNLMLRKLPEDLRDKVANTFTDLVDKEKEETKKAVLEKIEEMKSRGEIPTTEGETIEDRMKEVDDLISHVSKGPQRSETLSVSETPK